MHSYLHDLKYNTIFLGLKCPRELLLGVGIPSGCDVAQTSPIA
jgi:hypothetical protein